MNAKILIADKLAPEGADYLRRQGGVDVTTKTGLAGDDLIAALAGHDGVVVRSETQVTEPVIKQTMTRAGARLKAVARAGVGVDNIDLDAATRYGIAVMNSASASTITTAEHAFALMITLARNIAPAHMTMAAGGWDRNKFIGSQLHGKTLGIVGFGRIGQTLARRALAFGMKVIAYDPLINAESALDGAVRLLRSFDELLPLSDVISFHVPKTEQTTNMLNRERLARLKKGTLIVNAARGGIIDEAALIQAIDSGQCGGAALDVFDPEPLAKDSPLRKHPKILLTPHLGASTVEAQEAVAVDACKALLMYLRGEGLDGAVNAGGLRMDLTDRQKSFVDLAQRMIALVCASADELDLQAVRFTMRGESLAGRADTIARYALAELLRCNLDEPVTLINAAMIAQQRHIDVATTIAADKGEDRIAVELTTKRGAHRVEGAIYADGLPRITHLDGYGMDMVPAGHMVLLTNNDRPGRIGLVGKLFGDANVNIAEMVIGRKPSPDRAGQIAMMILKLDATPPPDLLAKLRRAEGIVSVSAVTLPHSS
ncbi:MAG: phosphoglycerate dehydrogenase [Phycisphaerales bacterium]|nr:phosphoglycerate dehydrogenase [Phycisphaerales bacterium]